MAIDFIYARQHPETREWEWLLSKEDFEKVRQGYGCPKCLEDYGGLCLETCPVCGHTRNLMADFTDIVPDDLKPGQAGPAPDPSLF